MVSDIYFPIPPSPYPAFYPISYPINTYPQNPRTILSRSHAPNTTRRNEQAFDTNRNNVPYYYAETLTPSSNNNINNYGFTNQFLNNRYLNNPFDRNQNMLNRKISPKLTARINASPELSQIFNKAPYQPMSFRPYSVLETSSKSPVQKLQRPSSVVPMTDQFRPASAFFPKENDVEKVSETSDWKARVQKDIALKSALFKDKPLRQICRIPNCRCNERPAVDSARFRDVQTLPTVSERSLSRSRNLSMPSLKLDEKLTDDAKNEAERDVNSGLDKPVSEHHLGFV